MSGSNVPPALNVSANGVGAVLDQNLNTFVQGAALLSTLRNFVGLSGMNVWMIGTATPGDGGQGMFVWSTTATTADDNGVTTIAPYGVLTGRWLRQSSQILTGANVIVDSGSANALVITVPGSPANQAALFNIGLLVEVANSNTGATTVNANGFGALPLVRRDGSPLIGNELFGAQYAWIIYDGGGSYELMGTYPSTNAVAAAGSDSASAVSPQGLAYTLQAGGYLGARMQVYGSPGTFTFAVPSTVYFLRFVLIGGGGGGAATAACSGSQAVAAPGGNGACRAYGLVAVTPGGTVTVVVGAGGVGGIVGGASGQTGGTTSITSGMTVISALGGHGGSNAAAATPPVVQAPTPPTNLATFGSVNDGEYAGSQGIAMSTGNASGGAGGGAGAGGGGTGTSTGSNALGNGGGGGGASTLASGSGQGGGSGGGGIVWLFW